MKKTLFILIALAGLFSSNAQSITDKTANTEVGISVTDLKSNENVSDSVTNPKYGEYAYIWTGAGQWDSSYPSQNDINNGYLGGTNPGNWAWAGGDGGYGPVLDENGQYNWNYLWTQACATMVFTKADSIQNGKNALLCNNVNLTLGGLIVESEALQYGKTAFSIQATNSSISQNLNIASRDEQKVIFDINENFSIGSITDGKEIVNNGVSSILQTTLENTFESVVIYSDWEIIVSEGKTFKIGSKLVGNKNITFSGGGTVKLYAASESLSSHILIKDGTTITFDNFSEYSSKYLLGTGDVTASNGKILFAGTTGSELTNNIFITQGCYFMTVEQTRSSYTYDSLIYINMSGNISGSGDWIRYSSAGLTAMNESWNFTGDNSGFTGKWYIVADTNQFNYTAPDGTFYESKDKPYNFVQTMFGNGSAYSGNDSFTSIAGIGDIIGCAEENQRGGSVLGINYASDVTLINNLVGGLKIRHLTDSVLTLSGTNTHFFGTYSEFGGTIRFTDAKNLGDTQGNVVMGVDENGNQTKITYAQTGGAIVALNNGSTIEYAGTGSISLTNALFNDSGSWGIKVTHQDAVLNWDLTGKGVYKYVYESIDSFRTGEFTKSGAGTLNITAGGLLTGSNSIIKQINVTEGTLQFSGTGHWGEANRIVLSNNTILKQETVSLSSGITLSTAQDYNWSSGQKAIIDGNLLMNGGTLEFMMNFDPARGAGVQDYVINGNFSINPESTSSFAFVMNDGAFFKEEGYYVLFTAMNDMSGIDWSKVSLTGLPELATSRQKYTLYTGGSSWGPGNINVVTGNNNEVYIHVSPDAAILTWNMATGGIWKTGVTQSEFHDEWTGHKSDSRFFDGDSVIFTDSINSDSKTITLGSDVNPSNIQVNGAGDYIFVSTNNYKITGQGVLSKRGSGSLSINMSNSYSGGTYIFDGTVIANAANALGTGKITIRPGSNPPAGNGPTLIADAENALGSCDILIDGGNLIINKSNTNIQNISLLSGTIIANATSSINGTMVVIGEGGFVYLKGDGAIGSAQIQVNSGGKIYAQGYHSLGMDSSTVVTINNGGIVSSEGSVVEQAFGTGTIKLNAGGYLDFYSDNATSGLTQLYIDGGVLRFYGNIKIDSSENCSVSALNQMIIDVVGADSSVTLHENQKDNNMVNLIKRGEGSYIKTLSTDWVQYVDIQAGTIKLTQAAGLSKVIYGSFSGVGMLSLLGDNHYLDAKLDAFNGTLNVALDSGKSVTIMQSNVNSNFPNFRDKYDVTIESGNIILDDTGYNNSHSWGNLTATTQESFFSTISVINNVSSSDIATINKHHIYITQSIDGEFNGKFVNNTNKNGVVSLDVTKRGGASLILSNDNSTTGTLSIDQGSIQLGNGGTTGFWAGNIVIGGDPGFETSLQLNYGVVDKTFNQLISGSGSVDIKTQGTVTFTNNNTYTGGTTISDSTVILSGEGSLGSGIVHMSGNSTLNGNNGAGMHNKSVVVQHSSTAHLKQVNIGKTGSVKSASESIVLTGGSLSDVVLNVGDNKTVLSGHVIGSLINVKSTIDEQVRLNNMHLDVGTSVHAQTGLTHIDGAMTISYNNQSLLTPGGDKIVTNGLMGTSASFTADSGASFSLTGLTTITLDLNADFLQAVQNENRIVINIFEGGIAIDDYPQDSITISLNDLAKSDKWTVSDENNIPENGWLSTGQIILVKNNPIPEPSSALLFALACSSALLRRSRKS